MRQVAILGLGLIGGSLGLALRQRTNWRVVGVNRRPLGHNAVARAAAHELVDGTDSAAVMQVVASSDLTVIALPVGAIVDQVGDLLEVGHVVTDCGSTKRVVQRAAESHPARARFVAGHPMAGRQMSGVEFALPDLFEDATWILCPDGSSPEAVAMVEEMVKVVGAKLLKMSAEEHDRAVALTSHVPQILASLLRALAERRGATQTAGTGFAGVTRTAGGAEAMWRDIFASNADHVAAVLREVSEQLQHLASGLAEPTPDLKGVLEVLAEARRLRDD
jgi:prephenate dehydrogenase